MSSFVMQSSGSLVGVGADSSVHENPSSFTYSLAAESDAAASNSAAVIDETVSKNHDQTGTEMQYPGQTVAPAEETSSLQAHTEIPPAKSVFPPFDTTYFASHLFWLAISFGLFYLFMVRVILPRIGGLIEMRRDRIAADLDQAARMKAETDAAIVAYQKSLTEARERAGNIARNAAEEAKAKAEAERKLLEEELELKLAKSEEELSAARDKALAKINLMATAAAAEVIKRISGKEEDQAAISHAVETVDAAGSTTL